MRVISHQVICVICKQKFDRDKVQATKFNSRRYAHATCYPEGELVEAPGLEAELGRQEVIDCAQSLFKEKTNYGSIGKYLKQFVNPPYNYDYTDIKNALIYFYKIKGNPVEKANGSLGIIPYIMQESRNYYYSMWLAKQKNEVKEIEQYRPKDETITIPIPKVKKRNKDFMFLDEEEN